MNNCLSPLSCKFCTQLVGSTTSFWDQNTTKSRLKSDFFADIFNSTLMCRVRLPRIALDTLVVMSND